MFRSFRPYVPELYPFSSFTVISLSSGSGGSRDRALRKKTIRYSQWFMSVAVLHSYTTVRVVALFKFFIK